VETEQGIAARKYYTSHTKVNIFCYFIGKV
jgi:hypothetical protein